MFTPLATKFFPQRVQPELVSRPRLIDTLNQALNLELTIISAPAGYGKSSLVAQWIANYKTAGNVNQEFVWLSLDEEDNDWVQFWQYIIAAFWQVDNEFGLTAIQALEQREEHSFNKILNSLVSDLETNYLDSAKQIVLVVDDFHYIENSVIHEQFDNFIKKVPSHIMHVLILSRQDPPFGLGRRRVKQQLTEIRALDLCFNDAECVEFFKNISSNVSVAAVGSLNSKAEGWVTGLQLLALSLKDDTNFEALIEEFTGDHRFIADFLIEEVFDQQSEEIQLFLMETAFLDRFTAPLCDAVRSKSTISSSNLIEEIEQKNLFLLSLDQHRQWYRYHHLFAELLQKRYLLRNTVKLKEEILLKASQWSSNQCLWQAAINYAFLAQYDQLAAKLITEFAEHNSNWTSIRADWITRVETYFDKYPSLFFIKCYEVYYLSPPEVTIPERKVLVNSILDKAIDNSSITSDQRLNAYYVAYRSLTLGDMGGAPISDEHISLLKDALKKLDLRDSILRSEIYYHIGRLYYFLNQFKEAIGFSQLAIKEAENIDDTTQVIQPLVLYCKGKIALGNVTNAYETANIFLLQSSEALKHHPKIGAVYHIVGHHKLATADYKSAQVLLSQAIQLTEISDTVTTVNILSDLFYVYWTLGDEVNAQAVFDKIDNQSEFAKILKNQYSYRLKLDDYQLHKVELFSFQQKYSRLIAENTHNITYANKSLLDVYCYICIEQYQEGMFTALKEPIEFINAMLIGKKETHFIYIVRMLLLSTHIDIVQRKPESAYESFKKVISMCSKEKGYNTTFFYYISIYEPLVQNCIIDGVNTEYCYALLERFQDFKLLKLGQHQAVNIENNKILSIRELDVLKLISIGLSNKAIAKNLDLSPNTVRAHASNIYSKLTVKNRTEAVTKAIDIGIINN